MRVLVVLLFFCLSANAQTFIVDSYRYAGPIVIYDGQNAADPVNEVNGVANTVNAANGTWSSQTTDGVTDGTYALKFTFGTTGTAATGRIQTQNILNGDQIQIQFDAQKVTGTNVFPALATADGWDVADQVTVSATSPTQYTLTATATADNPDIRWVYGSGATTGSASTVDNIVITKLN